MATLLSPQQLHERLRAPDALREAFLDVRDGGEYNDAHIADVTLLPRPQIEARMRLVVPDLATPITLVDSDGQRAHFAAITAEAMGYRSVAVLAGGIDAWQAAGLPTEWGSNVLSKDFGEKVQVQQRVTEVTPEELNAWMQRGENLMILDSRTPEEHTQACIPGSRSVPGGELPLRITDLVAANPTATVVVHCAGRTRSIIGARALQRMGVQNVFALKNGTMGWALAGLEVERGSQRLGLPEPSPEARTAAEAFAARVAREDGVSLVDRDWLRTRLAHSAGNIYLLDVRTQQEYEAGHIPGFQWVPGGQAVQRAEDAIGVRTGEIVFCCDGTARASVAAGWYRQMGYPNVYVLDGGVTAWSQNQGDLERCPMPDVIFGLDAAQSAISTLTPAALHAQVGSGDSPLVLHVGSSREYEQAHIAGATWLLRAWLEPLIRSVAPDASRPIVCTCTDGKQATLAAAALVGLGFTGAAALTGGMTAWVKDGLPVTSGLEHLATPANDVVRTGTERDRAAMIHYLEWEEALGRKYEQEG